MFGVMRLVVEYINRLTKKTSSLSTHSFSFPVLLFPGCWRRFIWTMFLFGRFTLLWTRLLFLQNTFLHCHTVLLLTPTR